MEKEGPEGISVVDREFDFVLKFDIPSFRFRLHHLCDCSIHQKIGEGARGKEEIEGGKYTYGGGGFAMKECRQNFTETSFSSPFGKYLETEKEMEKEEEEEGKLREEERRRRRRWRWRSR